MDEADDDNDNNDYVKSSWQLDGAKNADPTVQAREHNEPDDDREQRGEGGGVDDGGGGGERVAQACLP